MKTLPLCSLLLLLSALPAFASVTVTNPTNGETVNTTFSLAATAPNCSSQTVAAIGYSLDNGSDIAIVYSSAVNASVSAGTGAHTLHVKAWGNKGAVCVTDVPVTVAASSPIVPPNAASVSNIQSLGNWVAFHDSGTGGNSTGSTGIVTSPSRSGSTRQLAMSYLNYGGELYNAAFGDDTTSMNFFYDAWVYIAAGSSIANLEMDMNQVMPNGQTVIFGFQCDGWSGTWDYTANLGTPQAPIDSWLHSRAACNPAKWTANTWHHVQVSYSRDSNGKVTYKSVWFDGAQSDLNVTVSSAFALGWAPVLLTNFQIDGPNLSGGATVYLDNLTVYRW